MAIHRDQTGEVVLSSFAQEVMEGLSASPKYLSSKYFYDEKGDALFQQIMQMPEYYLTDCEMEIFTEQAAELVAAFGMPSNQAFELVELGAGDGTKTIKILEYLQGRFQFEYLPIDISENVLTELSEFLDESLPALQYRTMEGDYFEILKELRFSNKPKVVFFLGSNIGNMTDEKAAGFLQLLASNLNSGDKVLLGVDLIKAKEIVLPAYNDAAGITRAFNLNLLSRINRELGGDFNIEKFEHAPEYSEETGFTKSFLKSTASQTVRLDKFDFTAHFEAGETIHTEVSRKYNDKILSKITIDSGLEIKNKFTDGRGYFADYLLEKI